MITTTETKLLPEILAYLVNRPMVYTKPNVVNIDLYLGAGVTLSCNYSIASVHDQQHVQRLREN